jgi:hypothetical protein
MRYVLLALLGIVGMILATIMGGNAFFEFRYAMVMVWAAALSFCFGITIYANDKIHDHYGDEAVARFLTELSKRIVG